MTNSRTAEAELSRKLILDATERLMVQGYVAVSTRRVAAEAGVKAPLVHYYYKTTDDLLIALYHRSADETPRRLTRALASDNPLEELWEFNMDAPRTVLAVEFLALANHRPAKPRSPCKPSASGVCRRAPWRECSEISPFPRRSTFRVDYGPPRRGLRELW